MIRGGIADKLGNRYEAKWLVRKAMEVLAGKADWLVFEGVASSFQGFEFAVGRKKITEWHQTKINSPQGNWTIPALKTEKVLKAFATRLLADEHARCFFVSQDNAKDFRTLEEKAKPANSCEEYWDILSKEQKEQFRQLQAAWNPPDELVFDWLKYQPQSKLNSPQGNWTINALKKDNAKDFRTLTEKAQIANYFDEYWNISSKDDKEQFRQLQESWNLSDRIAFNWLKRSYVEILPERELDYLNESFGDLYFHQGSKSAFPNLRDLLEKNFNKKLTTEGLRKAVKEQGILQFKEWAFDPSIPQRLQEETEAYLGTYTPFGMGGETIPRTQADQILDELRKSDGPELILLTGVAGSGKSGIIRSVIQLLREAEFPHLAFRVDQHLDCATREELGERLTGRKESPVSTLKGTFPEKTSVLIIDQVDAVSEVSGRDGQVKEVLFRLIRDAHYFCGIKIIAVCRTFDFDSDARIKSLHQEKLTKKIEVPLLDWKNEVEPLLRKKHVDISRFSQPQRDLLCLPVNLAVFLEIDEPELVVSSRANLHEELIKKKQRQLPKGLQWSLVQPLTIICDWMSKRQKLSAPVAVLDEFPRAADILASEGLIVSSRGQLNFFHESFFDHIYARSFLQNEQSMVEWLTATEQHLFRRTQVRQILEALRRNDDQRYVEELASLLQSEKIRFHLKAAICQWLGSVDEPTEDEWQIISRFDDLDGKFPLLFGYAVLSISAAWFDLLNRKKWIEQQLAHDNLERVESIFSWLSLIAGKKQAEIAVLLRSWWNNDPQRVERLLHWFRFAHWKNPINCCDPLFDLCEEIIRSHPAILFKQKDDHFLFSILNDLSDDFHELGERILQVVFDGWFIAHPGKLPFGDDEFKIIERHDCHTLAEFAKKAPVEFLAAVTGFLIRCVDMVLAEERKGNGWSDFKFRTTSEHHYRFDGFLKIYREALKKIAQQQFDEAEKYLQQLDPHKHECLMHLHLEAIEANPEKFSHRLPNLAQDETVFKAGYDGADWLSFAHACKAAFPFLKPVERLRIEQDICKYIPEIKYYPSQLRYKQWCIFENIGESLLNFEAISLLNQLRRKFRNKKIEEPRNFEMRKIKAPISGDQCTRMKDRHWLSAIKKCCISNNTIEEYRIHELAGNIEAEASKNPVRFAKLCFHIPKEANRLYIEYLILGLAKTKELPHELTVQAVNFIHYHHLRFFGSSIATLIKKHPSLAANSEILEILIWYALNGIVIGDGNAESERIKNETYSIEQIIGKRSFLYQCDINGERGSAWEALSVVLPEVPQTEDRICEALEEAFEKESLVSVRCTMIRVLGQLYNINKNRFTISIKKLIFLPITNSCNAEHIRLFPLITHTGIDLFPYIFHRLPNLAKELVTELLECGDETKELLGAWLIFGQSFRNDEYIEQAEQLAARSVNHRRLLADVAADVLTWTENRRRAENLLKEFFFDEDKQVREQASHVFGKLRGEEIERCRELAEHFPRSPAFPEHSLSFLWMLKEATCDVLDLVVETAERIITDAAGREDYRNNGINMNAHQLNDLLKREYVSSEKNAEARKRLLDLIDRMLAHNIYGVDSIVSAHDRW